MMMARPTSRQLPKSVRCTAYTRVSMGRDQVKDYNSLDAAEDRTTE